MRDGGSGEEPAFEALVQQLCSQQTKPICPCFNLQTSGPGCSTTSFSEHTTFDFLKTKNQFFSRSAYKGSSFSPHEPVIDMFDSAQDSPYETATHSYGNPERQQHKKEMRVVKGNPKIYVLWGFVFFFCFFFLLWLFLSHGSGTGTKRKGVTSDQGTH